MSNQHRESVDQPASGDDIMGIQAVSDMTGIPAATLRYYRHIHTGPVSFKLGPKRIAYRRSSVTAWLEAQEALSSRGDAA